LANGGHCYPLLLPRNGPPSLLLKRLGMALGFEPGLAFERVELSLRDGDAVTFYTDGVTEAFNPEEELYGSERLLADAGLLPVNLRMRSAPDYSRESAPLPATRRSPMTSRS
jgi:sigma-B regulation protein RsbU (phosphoserine phosphatase)